MLEVLDQNGNMVVTLEKTGIILGSGAKILGEDGLMNTYLFSKEGNVGFNYSFMDDANINSDVFIDVIVPANLNVTKAVVKLIHSPCYWSVTNLETGVITYTWGYSRNIRLSKCTNINSRLVASDYGGGVWSNDDTSVYSEIPGAFGTDGFTAHVPSDTAYDANIVDSIDISSELQEGLNRLKISTINPAPNTRLLGAAQTGGIQMVVTVEGYINY